MASNVAVLIDAGYLRACAIDLLSTTDLVFDPGEMRAYVQEFITAHFPTQRLLRIYWYDATRTGFPTPHHDVMARSDYFSCRLGILGRRVGGEPVQKEVDTLLTLDIVELARNRAADDIVLITGDRDFRPAVIAAQVYGVRIHLIGVEPIEENQAKALAEACDTNRELDRAQLAKFCGFDLAALERARFTNMMPKIGLAPPLPNADQAITGMQPELSAEVLSEADIQALLAHAAHEEFKKYINWKTDDEVVMHATQVIAQFRDQGSLDNKLNSMLVKRVRKVLATRSPTDVEIQHLQASFIDELTKHLDAAQLNGLDDSTSKVALVSAPSPKVANDAS